jgi:hypothetical protein
LDGLASFAGQGVQRRVVSDLQKPAAKRRCAFEPVQAVIGPQERVLADVLSVAWSDNPGHNAKDHVAVALHELLKSGQLTLQSPGTTV